MTTLFLLFAVMTSLLVYFGALAVLRRMRPTARQYRVILLSAFVVQALICVWLGYGLRGVIER